MIRGEDLRNKAPHPRGRAWPCARGPGAACSVQDRDGALLLSGERDNWPRLRRVYADGGYAGALEEKVAILCDWLLDIVRRSDEAKGFVVIRKSLIVERTFAWLGKCRRLSKDYERLKETSEGFIHAVMINLMLHRLAPEV